MPGLINGHAHAAMPRFRGLVDDLDLPEFLDEIRSVEKAMITRESVRAGARLGIAELLLSGITCFVDMYWHCEQTALAAIDLGARVAWGEVFVDFMEADYCDNWERRLDVARNFISKYQEHSLVTSILCPHSCYTISERHLRDVRALADEKNVSVHLHASEAQHEMLVVEKMHLASPIEVLDRVGLLRKGTSVAHAVHISDEEITKISDTKASIIHCPVSNMKMASGTTPVSTCLDAGILLGLGTATSNDLSIWMNMRVTALQQKVRGEDPTLIPTRAVVRAATIGGANAIFRGDKIGLLEVGKKADIILVDCDKAHASPVHDVYSHLVYAARPDDVKKVIVNSEIVVREKRLQKATVGNILSSVRELSRSAQPSRGALSVVELKGQ